MVKGEKVVSVMEEQTMKATRFAALLDADHLADDQERHCKFLKMHKNGR